MATKGKLTAKVEYGVQSLNIPLVVIADEGPSLLGRDWLRHLKLDWRAIQLMSVIQLNLHIQQLQQKYKLVFSEGQGAINHFKVQLKLKDPNSQPVFMKHQLVPFALKEAVGKKLDRLEKEGVLEKVSS